ncbi:uncharacterized protein LOC129890548 [Solanum dulcamara]|uniref:uncharacterized protein LOC129890548 n=1 Tax=Solanum dulcamara TaxID=45834 RepID=UPI0024854CD9|nr:uncharacterized protein LOC129890548 [Solanum dulcamara]
MGSLQTKNHKSNPNAKIIEGLKYKVRLLQKEVSEIMRIRGNESEIYNQEMIIFALKEEEWKQEKKKLNEEVNDLKKKLKNYKEDEEKFRGMENHEMVSEKCDNKEFHMLVRNSLLEQIRVEEVRRDEAIEKWKNLYFVIKYELDELIQRTNPGERLRWRTEEVELLEELHMELKAKEEVIAYLKDKIASMEKQEVKRDREIDILRQSLKIMSYNKKVSSLSKVFHKN